MQTPVENPAKRPMPAFPHTFPFDPTYGHTRERLLAIQPPEAPDDFDAFWAATWHANAAVPLDLDVTYVQSPSPRFRMRMVRYTVLGGHRVGAWLLTPVEGPVDTAAICGHGYGGRDAPDVPEQQAAFMFFCAPGFHLSAAPSLPADAYRHVVHGIGHRDTYLIRSCVAAIWSAAKVIEEVTEQSFVNRYYFGGSFGGGLGALAVPYDDWFTKCMLAIPTFGHHPLRLQCRCQGSGEAVRLYAEKHPDVREVLAYYDAAVSATRIRIPNVTLPALFDPAVPPPGQFAISNAMAVCGKRYIYSAGHYAHPDEEQENREAGRLVNQVLWDA